MMKRAFTSAVTFCAGALVGAVALSLFLGLLFWMLNPTQISTLYGSGTSVLLLLFTVPIGGIVGGILAAVWFSEGRQ
jgi:Na+-transporting NADH:ubiquinone oxidoreductase subunit NqrE